MVSDLDFDPFIEGIARELKRPVHLDARFDDRVMAALNPAVIPISVHRDRRPWYRRSRSFSISPLGGLAAAALAGVAALGTLQLRAPEAAAVATRTTASAPVAVQQVSRVKPAGSGFEYQQFIVVVPQAHSVALVGDFNDWDATRTPMERLSADGAWSAILPLRAGRYEYQFVVDGTLHITDPTRPQTSSDFGSPNSVVTVAPAN